MIKLLAVFLSLYSAMHALFYFRVRVLLPDRRGLHIAFVLFLSFMVVAPIVSRLLERNGFELPARFLAVAAFSWTGFIFLAFCGAILMQLADVVLWLVNLFVRADISLLSGKLPAFALIAAAILFCFYGFFESRHIRTERLVIKTEKLPEKVGRLKIVQITDVHLGLLAGKTLLKKISRKIRRENPDILVSTGDLIDGSIAVSGDDISFLEQIPTRFGKYAVTGNHETYAGLQEALALTRRFGFRVLRNEAVTVNGTLNIVGMDDSAADGSKEEERALSSLNNGLFTILLKHRPWVSNKSLGRFDLQLSGHTHGGQIFPFRYVVNLQYPFPAGAVELPKGSRIYTSRGTGTWGPQVRVFSPPEITVIELVHEKGEGG